MWKGLYTPLIVGLSILLKLFWNILVYKWLHAWVMWELYIFTKVIVEYINVEMLHAPMLSGVCVSLMIM
jgi:hypothetical protein